MGPVWSVGDGHEIVATGDDFEAKFCNVKV